jgi:hypothetical protein
VQQAVLPPREQLELVQPELVQLVQELPEREQLAQEPRALARSRSQ